MIVDDTYLVPEEITDPEKRVEALFQTKSPMPNGCYPFVAYDEDLGEYCKYASYPIHDILEQNVSEIDKMLGGYYDISIKHDEEAQAAVLERIIASYSQKDIYNLVMNSGVTIYESKVCQDALSALKSQEAIAEI